MNINSKRISLFFIIVFAILLCCSIVTAGDVANNTVKKEYKDSTTITSQSTGEVREINQFEKARKNNYNGITSKQEKNLSKQYTTGTIKGDTDILKEDTNNNPYEYEEKLDLNSTNNFKEPKKILKHNLTNKKEANPNDYSLYVYPINDLMINDNVTITGALRYIPENAVISNIDIELKVDGRTITVNTGPTGIFGHNYRFTTTGQKTVTATFDGTGTSLGRKYTTSVYFNVYNTKRPSFITFNQSEYNTYPNVPADVSFKLHDVNNRPIVNQTVNIAVGSSIFSPVTNESGIGIVDGLSLGVPYEFDVVANYGGNNLYYSTTSSNKFIINSLNKEDTVIDLMPVLPVKVGNQATIKGCVIALSDNSALADLSVTVTVGGKNYTAVTSSTTGYFTVITDPFTKTGTYPVDVIFKEHYAYKGSSTRSNLTVQNSIVDTNISIKLPSVSYEGEGVPITAGLHIENGNLIPDKTIYFYLDGEYKENFTSSTGSSIFTLSNINPGEYNITFKFLGDENFKASENSTTLIVNSKNKINITIKLNDISPVIVGNKAIITGKIVNSLYSSMAYKNVLVKVIVAGKEHTARTNPSTDLFTVETEPLTQIGTFPVQVVVDENYYLNGNSTTSSVVVYQRLNTNISIIAPRSIVAGQSAHIKFILHDDEGNPIPNKFINMSIGTTQLREKVDSSGVYETDTIINNPGIVDIKASIDEDSYVYASFNSTSMTVNSTNMQHTTVVLDDIPDMIVEANPIITGNILVTGTNQGVPNANLTLKINGVSAIVTTDGAGSFRYDSLVYNTPADVTVKAIFEDTPYYYGNESETSFKVLKEAIQTNITIETSSKIVYEEENVSVKFTLHDNEGNPIANKLINIEIGNSAMEVRVNNRGVYETTFIVAKNGNINTMNISAQKAKEGIYGTSKNSTTLTILPKQNTSLTLEVSPTTLVNTPVTISGTLLTQSSEKISGVNVTITADGREYVVTTDNSGKYSQQVTFNTPKRVQITATFNSNREYYGSTNNTSINVYNQRVETNITITAPRSVVQGSDIPITFYLHDAEGNPIRGVIIISYSGTTSLIELNDEGICNHTIQSHQPQIIEIKATIPSDEVLIGSTNTTKVVVNSTDIKNTSIIIDDIVEVGVDTVFNITGYVKVTGEENAAPGVPVKVTVDEINYDTTTDHDGKFIIEDLSFSQPKTVEVIVVSEDNGYYIGNQSSTSFIIYKYIETGISIDIPSEAYLDDVIPIKFYLYNKMDASAISNRNITISIGENTQTVTVNEQGIYETTFTPNKTGILYVNASFAKDAEYLASTNSTNTSVNKIGTNIIINSIQNTTRGSDIQIIGYITETRTNTKMANVNLTLNTETATIRIRTDENGNFNWTYHVNDSRGIVQVNATYDGNNKYNASNSQSYFNVFEQTVTRLEVPKGVIQGENYLVSCYVNNVNGSAATGKLRIKIGDANFELHDLRDGKVDYYTKASDIPQTISVIAIFDEQNFYVASNDTAQVIIYSSHMKNTTVVIDDIEEIAVGQYTTITGHVQEIEENKNLSAVPVTVVVSGKTYQLTTNSEGLFETPRLTFETLGTVTINATYAGNETHNGSTTTKTFNVVRGEFTPVITLDNINQQIAYNNVTISGQLSNAYSINDRDILLSIGNKNVAVKTDSTGKFIYNYTCDTVGIITVNATFNQNSQEAYLEKEARNSTTFNVVRKEFTPKISLNSISQQTTLNQVTITGQLSDAYSVNNRDILLSIGNKNVTVKTDSNGKFIYNYTCDTVGMVTVNAIFNQNSQEAYLEKEARNSTTFNVVRKEFTPKISLNSISQQTTLNQVTITGQLSDAYSVNNRDILLSIGNKNVTVKTDSTGKFIYNYTCDTVGIITVNAIFNQNSQEAYLEKEARNSTTFNVVRKEYTPVITLNNIGQQSKSNKISIIGQLSGANSLNNRDIQLSINGKTTTIKTDTNGKFTYNYTCDTLGKITVIATFNENSQPTYLEKQARNTTTFNVIEPVHNTSITINNIGTQTVGSTVTITGKLKDTTINTPLSNVDVVLTINNMNYNIKTDNAGVYKQDYSTSIIGTNNVTVKYNGNNSHNPSTNTTKFTVENNPTINTQINLKPAADVLVSQTTQINGTLKDVNGKIIPNAKITVLLNEKVNTTLTTDSNGNFVYNYLVSNITTNKVTFNYAGNKTYNPSTNSTSLTSRKAFTVVTVDPLKGIVGNNITFTVHVKDERGNLVTGGNVAIKLNGRTLRNDGKFNSNAPAMKFTVKNGLVTVTIVADKFLRDAKNVSASYSGSGKYLANDTKNSTTAQIQLRKAALTVTTSPRIQQQYKIITFTAKITDITQKLKTVPHDDKNSYVYFKVNGVTLKDAKGNPVKAKIVNGVAQYNYTVPKGMAGISVSGQLRNYSVTAGFYHPDYYPDTKNTTKFNVERSGINVKVKSATANMKTRKLTITGSITDYMNNNVIGTNKVNVKVNGKSLMKNNKAVYVAVTEGVMNIVVDIPSNIGTVKSITLVTGERCSYKEGRTTYTNIKSV